MDIDEFLDKEIQPLRKEESKEDFANQPPEELNIPSSEFPKSGKAGNLEALEKTYLGLWEKISKDKIGWSSSLYTEIMRTGDEIKKNLSILSSKISNDKKSIRRLMFSARSSLERKNYQDALKLYSEIITIRNNMPDAFFDDKQDVNREILPFYAKLAEQIDIKFAKDFNEHAAKVESLLSDSFSSIGKNDIISAKSFYEQALSIYQNMPQGFVLRKIELGNKLMALYKELSIVMQIENLQQQLSYERKNGIYKQAGTDERIKHLSEIAGHSQEMHSGLKKQVPISDLRNISEGHKSKYLLDKIISRKLEAANASMSKGFYPDAKKNIESVLRLDPHNKDAKNMLKKIKA